MWFRRRAKAAKLVTQGDKALKANRLDDAEWLYREALRIDAKNAEATYSLGCVASNRGRYQEAFEWATQASTLDPNDARPHALRGNALFGLERFEEAAGACEAALAVDSTAIGPRAQLGLLYEKLGRLEDAEKHLRDVLSHDTSYNSRFQLIAFHLHSPFFADMHHALARVLQRQGNAKEAWMHYHLARRHDPVIQLDPMHREIVSDIELENHPYYDKQEIDEPSSDTSAETRYEYLLQCRTFDTLESAARRLGSEDLKAFSVQIIRAAQASGQFRVSAFTRLLADAIIGEGDPETFDVARSAAARELFSLAEEVFADRLERAEAMRYAKRISWGAPPRCMLRFLARFIAVDPGTSLHIVELFAESLPATSPISPDALGLVAKTQFRLRKLHEARATFERVAALYEDADNEEGMVVALMQVVEMSADNPTAALAALDRCLLVDAGDLEPAVHFKRAEALHRLGRLQECREECRLTVADARAMKHPGLAAAAKRLETDVTARLGQSTQPMPEEASADGDSKADDEPAKNVDYERALRLTESLLTRAFADNAWPTYISLLHRKGGILITLERYDEAREVLHEASERAKPLQALVDRWPILVDLALLARQEGNNDTAIKYLREALAQARRNASHEQEAETHALLAALLANTDQDLAVAHADRHMELGSTDDYESDAGWSAAKTAFDARNYSVARDLFERIAATPASRRGIAALINSAQCCERLGDIDEAIDRYEESARRATEAGLTETALDALSSAARAAAWGGHDPKPLMAEAVANWQAIDNLGIRRSSGIGLAQMTRELGDLSTSENVAREVIDIATGDDWRSRGDEMRARSHLGATLRLAGRYDESIEQYTAALDLAQALQDEPYEAEIRGWLAISCRYAGDLDRAIEEYEKAIEIAERYQQWENAAGHRMNLCFALLMLSRKDEALAEARLALATFDTTGLRQMSDRLLASLASSIDEEQFDAAERDRLLRLEKSGIDSHDTIVSGWAARRTAKRRAEAGDAEGAASAYERVIERFRTSGDHYNEIVARLHRANAILPLDPQRAQADADEVLGIAEQFGQQRLVVWAHELMLRIALQNGDPATIERNIIALLPHWTTLRRKLHKDNDRVALAGEQVELLDECVAKFAASGDVKRLFDVFEYGRAQALIDLFDLTDNTTDVRYASLQTARELLDAAQRPAILVSVAWSEMHLIALTLRAGEESPQLHAIDVSREEVVQLHEMFEREIHTYQGQSSNAWRHIVARIVAPFASRIKRDDLVFLAVEEDLQSLPLHAAKLPDGALLCTHADVVYGPSVTILDRLRRRAMVGDRKRGLVAVGVAFQDEALLVMRKYPGIALTGVHLDKTGVLEAIRDAAMIHFSCHGYFDRDDSLESGLVLSAAEQPLRSDILSTRDLLQTRLRSELVTLSACDTARGDVASAEFLGLTRAFIAAGTRGVLSTLWKVPAPAALEMMTSFYQRVSKAREQASTIDVARILRQTQCEMIDKPLYDWAAFKLIGWPLIDLGSER